MAITVDQALAGTFLGKVVTDCAGAMIALLCALGDRLGLFKDLATNGPATSDELAARLGLDPRYTLEWLRGMRATGYVLHDPASDRYELPREHAVVLADEAGPLFIAPGFGMLAPLVEQFDRVVHAFEAGGGVPQSEYSAAWWQNMQRFTAAWYEHELVEHWIGALPSLRDKLERGAAGADIGCGGGRAVIKLAQAFPESRFTGFDVVPEQIELARASAERAGVSDRTTFVVLDAGDGLPGRFDLVTSFDALHEAVDPRAALQAMRDAVKNDGTVLMSEMNCADRHEDNATPMHALFYGMSIFYCMTTVMAHGGAAVGTCGMPEAEVRRLCSEVGFAAVRRVEPAPEHMSVASLENILYELTPA